MDFRRLLDDVSAMAGALRQLTTGPALQATLADLHGLSTNLRQLSARLDRQVDPLARSAQQTLGDARALMGSLPGSNEVLALDNLPQPGMVRLLARWSLVDPAGRQPPQLVDERIDQPWDGSPDGLVLAQRSALHTLARHIARGPGL